MPKARVQYALFACGVLLVSGCTMLPGMLGGPAATSAVVAPPNAQARQGQPQGPNGPPEPPPAQQGPPFPAPPIDPREVDAQIAEIARNEGLDPASVEEFAQGLHQSDPKLWGLLLQTYRATAAYNRQRQEREAEQWARAAADAAFERSLPRRIEAPEPPPAPPAREDRDTQPSVAERIRTNTSREPVGLNRVRNASSEHAPLEQPPAARPQRDASRLDREKPAEATGAKAPSSADQKNDRPATALPSVMSSENWRDRLTATINALESEVRQMPKTPAEVELQSRLRLLYLLADRREDALKPLVSAPTATQEFWSQELYGLATWMDSERITDASRRAGESKLHLSNAVNRLGDLAPLMVRNLTFVFEVTSFGDFKAFDRCEFSSGQEVGLYAEVENFKSEETPKGFFTSLRGKYEVFDSRGESVHKQDLNATEEYCRNPRRDFFLGYRLHLPKGLHPGRYRLQLTVEDVKKQQVAQSSIDFTIKLGNEGAK